MTTTRIPDGQSVMQELFTKKSAEMTDNLTQSFADVMQRADSSKSDVTNLVDTEPGTQIANRTEKQTSYASDKQVQDTERRKACDNQTPNKTSDTRAEAPKESQDAVSEDAREAITKTAEDVQKELSEMLGISEEMLTEIMQILGLNFADLGQQGNMIQVMAMTSEDITVANVMMDESLMGDVKALVSVVEEALTELSGEFGLSPEDVTRAIDEALSMENGSGSVADMADFMQTGKAEEAALVTTSSVETEVTMVDDTEDASEGNLDDARVNVQTQDDAKANNAPNQENNPSQDANQSEIGEREAGRFEGVATTIQNAAGAVSFDVNATQTETPMSYIDAEKAREIISMVAEQVKLRVSEQITEMEIQLNPANLGKLNLQVASREGVITAQITTTNEDVRAALELQAMALKEELNQQGLKVEAVDVSVSSHEFERNLEQDQQQNADEEAYKEQLRKGTRKSIDLKELTMDDLSEMSEAEMIQIDMMNRRGNRMNLMA